MDIVVMMQDFYVEKIDVFSDPRTQDWLFVSSPVPTFCLTLFYILFSCKIGPALMKNREPLQLKNVLLVYNIAMTCLNCHIFKELLFGVLETGYNFPCEPCHHNTDPPRMRIAAAIWWYYISKFIEFLDTLFFILRKKNSHISFLHVYHHSTITVVWWIGIKCVPGCQSSLCAMTNAFIHILMYSYYGLAALGPKYQKYLWWKQYLTQLQLIQFCIGFFGYGYTLINDCDYPRWMNMAFILYMISFLILFGNFYLRAYINKVPKRRKHDGNVIDDTFKNGSTSNGNINNEELANSNTAERIYIARKRVKHE